MAPCALPALAPGSIRTARSEWNIGRIYEVRGGPEHLQWFWAMHFPSKPESLRTDNCVATLEAAKAEFEANWRQWVVGSSRAFGVVSHCHWLSGHQATLVYGIGPISGLLARSGNCRVAWCVRCAMTR